ncbi:MAG: DUF4185 domain-containing protein [Propioniciclava sp.]|uniref:DUF4185 domain-containing protein n=1 Tax=Propioniciclava sp. TaxID=2038686 RepID=UPI0039E38F63
MDDKGVTPVLGPSSLVQGIAPSAPGVRGLAAPTQLDAVLLGADGSGLWHYRRAQDRPDRDWRRGELISPDAVGPGAIVARAKGCDVFVPEPGGVAHYRAANATSLRWESLGIPLPGRAVSATVAGGVLIVAATVDDAVEIWVHRHGWCRESRLPDADAAALASEGNRWAMVMRQDGRWWFPSPVGDERLLLAGGPTGLPAEGGGDGPRGPAPENREESARPGAAAAIAPMSGGWLIALADADRVDTWTVLPGREPTPDRPLTWGAGIIRGLALAPSSLRSPELFPGRQALGRESAASSGKRAPIVPRWRRPGAATGDARVAADASALVAAGGWLQALTDEDGSVFHHHRQDDRSRRRGRQRPERDDGTSRLLGASWWPWPRGRDGRAPTTGPSFQDDDRPRWMRHSCVRLDDRHFTVDPVDSHKLAQVSGDVDTQPTLDGGLRPTLSRSASTAGVRGTDLGVRVDHRGASYLLFGDSHWRRRPWLVTRDAIARLTPDGPIPGLPGVRFHGAPLQIDGLGVTMREYDVPLDAFSTGGDFFLLATSNHFARFQTMGRSVLARAADPRLPIESASRRPLRFTALCTLSGRLFINVSAQRFPASRIPGWGGDHDVILLFGTDAYRAGNLRLAVLDPRRPGVADALASPGPISREALGLRYWAGMDAVPLRPDGAGDLSAAADRCPGGGVPVWSEREEDARPLLHPGAFGEISVRWVAGIERFLLLAGSGPEDPIGPSVTLRTSPTPWGPWTPRHRLLDWVARGMSHHDPSERFIKAHGDGDPVGDRVFTLQARSTGAGYAPYLFDATPAGDHLVLRYTLSTWNPYQVVLLEHRLACAR